jgi:hypothetical protein
MLILTVLLNIISVYSQTSDYREYVFRYLQIGVSVSPTCSKTAGYQTPVSPGAIQIKRLTDNMYTNDGFIMTDNISFNTQSTTFLQNSWEVSLFNIGLANMFFGFCVYNTQTCSQPDYYDHIIFNGISIIYHSTDCYHLDHHYNNINWTRPRHCLSLYELLSLVFKYSIQLKGGKLTLTINYDNFDYYIKEIWLASNELTGEVLDMASPCVLLYVKDTTLEMRFQ